jgi:hypothetical protein
LHCRVVVAVIVHRRAIRHRHRDITINAAVVVVVVDMIDMEAEAVEDMIDRVADATTMAAATTVRVVVAAIGELL